MPDSSITLNPGSGGANAATWQDATSRHHDQVVTQFAPSVGADPVSVSPTNPMPVTLGGSVQVAATQSGNWTVGLNAGAATIGAVTQGPNDWTVVGNIGAGNADSGNGVKISAVYNTSQPTYTNGNRSDLQSDVNGNLCVNIKAGAAAGGTSSSFNSGMPASGTAIGASDGTNMKALQVDGSGNLKINIAAGGVSAAQDNTSFTAGTSSGLGIVAVYNDGVSAVTSGNYGALRMTADRKLLTSSSTSAGVGYSPAKLVSAATTNATSLKGSAGTIGAIYASNSGAGWAYLKFYNKATSPTVGTDVPVWIEGLPPGGGGSLGVPVGIAFSTGIAYAVTGGAADNDTTAVALNQVIVSIGYV